MHRLEAVERKPVFLEGRADLDDVLVERAAADVGMNAPDGMDELLAGDDRVPVRVQVGEDAELLPADLVLAALGELDLEAVGMDL